MVLHIMHFPMHILLEPLFQAGCFLFKEFGLGYTTRQKAEALCFGFYELADGIGVVKQESSSMLTPA